ncbi:MAG: helix-turn-helix domain-containing protein [Bacteroidales bacterium]|nr:helix-turn-helix domain-containing protein [Bacteroidales bacterium]MBQ9723278.1 helix-turn-helix domain-containing protein [Bacteroidales bacterium]
MAKIKNKETYDAVMKRIDVLFDSTYENTSPEDPRLLELDLLSELVEEYEKEEFPIETPSLASVIQHRMHEMKLSQKELAAILGMTAPRLCDILNGKKEPTFQQARQIAAELRIDADIILA